MAKFVKTNHLADESLLREAEGLEALSRVIVSSGIDELRVPEVYSVSARQLVTEFVHHTHGDSRLMAQFGRGLAKLHLVEQRQFGWHNDNFIGLSPQPNQLVSCWGTFFTDYRLRYQIDNITDKQLRSRFSDVFNQHREKLVSWLNEHTSTVCLLHGDLWSGNVLFGPAQVWLIDPAVYCGDRDADIAMTEMFGGFTRHFYAAYQELLPLSSAYQQKR